MENNKKVLFVILLIAIMSMIVYSPITHSEDDSSIIYVATGLEDAWYNATNVRTIFEGITNVTDGGTIYIWDGTYTENVTVNKSVTIIGNSSSTTFIRGTDADNYTKAIFITADNVNMSGLNITGADYVIYSDESCNSICIENCEINDTGVESSGYSALQLAGCENIFISNTSMFGNHSRLIYFAGSGTINITNVTCTQREEVYDTEILIDEFDSMNISNSAFYKYELNVYCVSEGNVTLYNNTFLVPDSFTISYVNNVTIVYNNFSSTNEDYSYIYMVCRDNVICYNNTLNRTDIWVANEGTIEYAPENILIENNTFTYSGIMMANTGPYETVSIYNNTINGTEIVFIKDTDTYSFQDNDSVRQVLVLNVTNFTLDNITFQSPGLGAPYVTVAQCENVVVSNITNVSINYYYFYLSLNTSNITIQNVDLDEVEAPIYVYLNDGGTIIVDNVTATGEIDTFFNVYGSLSSNIMLSNISIDDLQSYFCDIEYSEEIPYISFDNITVNGGEDFLCDDIVGETINVVLKNSYLGNMEYIFDYYGSADYKNISLDIENTYIDINWYFLYDYDNISDSRFSNLTINIHSPDEPTIMNFLIATNFTIENSSFIWSEGYTSDCITIDQFGSNITIDNCNFLNDSGNPFYYCDNLTIQNCVFDCLYDGIEISESQNIVIKNNTLNYYCTLEYCENVLVSYNNFIGDSSYSAIDIYSCLSAIVEYNNISLVEEGIEIWAYEVTEFIVRNNNISNVIYGIIFWDCTEGGKSVASIHNNTISNFTYGIYMDGYNEGYFDDEVIIKHNNITSTSIVSHLGDENQFYHYRNHFYVPTSGDMTYDDALAEAESLGGYLCEIIDTDENEWLLDTFGSDVSFGYKFSGMDWLWEHETDFFPAGYTNWADGEPNLDGSYVFMNEDGDWEDTSNDFVEYIIEIEPPTGILLYIIDTGSFPTVEYNNISGGVGIDVGFCDSFVLQYNNFSDCNNAIYSFVCDEASILNNTINNSEVGVSSFFCEDTVIRDNIINGSIGIEFGDGGSDQLIEYNNLTGGYSYYSEPQPWFDSDWLYRKEIVFSCSQVSDDLENFPVLINITDTDLQSKALSNGSDILFTDSTGAIQFNHEIEYYNDTTGQLVAWVNVTEISSWEDTVIYMYYGNSESGNQQNVEGVWDSNYVIVHHMEDASTSSINDSTSNSYDGTKKGANEPVNAAGKFGYAQDFDGSDDYVNFQTYAGTAQYEQNNQQTISVWVYNENDDGCICGDRYAVYNQAHGFSFDIGNTGVLYGSMETTSNKGMQSDSSATVSDNTWTYVTYTYTGGSSGNNMNYYADSILLSKSVSKNTLTSGMDVSYSGYYGLGRLYGSGPTYQQFFNGALDEFRISNIARSSDWIKTEYNNMNNAIDGGFYTIGPEETSDSLECVYTEGMYGIIMDEQEYIIIRNNNISSFLVGISFDTCFDTVISNNTMLSVYIGIGFVSGLMHSDHIIEYNNLYGGEDAKDGIYLECEDNVTIRYNTIENFDDGIDLETCFEIYILNNTIICDDGFGTSGIKIYDDDELYLSDFVIKYNNISGNRTELSYAYGIDIEYISNITVQNNNIQNVYDGIHIENVFELKPIQYNNLEDIWGDGISVGSEDVENITIQYNNITGTHTEEVISYGIDAGGVNITIQRNNISSFDIGICSSLLNSFIRNNTVTNISGYGIEVRGDYCDGESELIYWSSPSGETDEIAVEQCSAIEFTVPEDVYYISLVNILPDYWVYCNEAIYCAGFSEVLTTDTEQWLTYEEHLDSGDDENNAILISEPFGVTPGETLFVIWYFEPYDCSHYDVTYYLAEEDLDFTSYYYDEGFEELEDDYYVEIYGYTCYKSGYYLTENNNITGTKEIDTETDYQSGIQMTNVVNAETRYNNISIFDNGIYMDECSITCTDNNTISNVSDAGIALLGHSHHTVENNNITALYWDDGEFLYYGDDGIYIDDESYVTIQYNNISSVYRGVYIRRSDYTYTMNNIITNFSGYGISILGVIPECLLEGTQILMSDGSKKPIEDIQVGDVVKGHSGENTVYDLYHYILGDNLVYSINDGKYFVTGPHPFMTTEGWKAFEPIRAKEFNPQLEINQLEIGDILLTIDGTIELKTISTKEFPYDTPIYNFAVTGDETYYGDGYLVHNKCPRVFSKSGDDYVFDVLINVEFVGVENDKLYRFPLKYFNANEPEIKIVNDPLEYNYIDFVKIIVTDTSESGDEVKTTILDPIDILCNNCTNTSCNLSLLLERDGKYLENDKKVNSEIFITFEDAPILKEGYTRDIEIYSGGYQDIYESFVPDCRCIEEFLYYYWTHSIRTDEICYYSLEPIALLGHSHHLIEYNNLTGDMELLGEEGSIGIGIAFEDDVTIQYNNISFVVYGVDIRYSDHTYTQNNTLTSIFSIGITVIGGEEEPPGPNSDHLIEYNNITGDSEEASIGILLEDEDNVTIQYNNISFFDMGIIISSSSLTFTKNNTITDVVSYGIYIMGNMVASDHLIEYNYIVEGESILEEVSIGVYVEQEENVTIRYNDISYFHTAGISTVYCYDIYIHDNTFSLMYQYVIKSEYDYFVEIYNHDLSSSDCESDLIYIEYAQFAQIYFNTLDNAGSGLFIKGCDNLAVYTNYFRDNDYGILMLEGETIVDFLCFNNYFDNAESNVCCPYDQEDIQWNITKTLGTNIIGGPYLMGNYWSDYAGVDDDDDGIGDTSYEVPTCLL